MRHLWLTASIDILESLRAKWFLVYSLVFGRSVHFDCATFRAACGSMPGAGSLPRCARCVRRICLATGYFASPENNNF
jgi:hypothetical protein